MLVALLGVGFGLASFGAILIRGGPIWGYLMVAAFLGPLTVCRAFLDHERNYGSVPSGVVCRFLHALLQFVFAIAGSICHAVAWFLIVLPFSWAAYAAGEWIISWAIPDSVSKDWLQIPLAVVLGGWCLAMVMLALAMAVSARWDRSH